MLQALGAIVSRRYKHFLWLYDRLADLFPCLSLPPMPVKQYSGADKCCDDMIVEGYEPLVLSIVSLTNWSC